MPANDYFVHGRISTDVMDKTLVDEIRTGFDLLDADIMRIENKFSDLTDTAAARTKLQIAAAGLLDVGTASGTIAAGDHTHGYLFTYNNLSDVGDVPTARSNLGLGSASILDVEFYGTPGGAVEGNHIHSAGEIPYVSFIDYKFPELNLNINTIQKGIDYALAYYQYLNAGGVWPPIYPL